MERDQTSPGGDDPSSDETEKVGREPKTREARPTVVGIGGSAGALKALVTFFESIPQETGMAFVVVVHLAPEHQSLLPEVLGRAAALPVIQVTRRIPLAPDHIYVIPPGKNLVVTNSHLSVAEFQGPTGRQTTIDYFFRSLASNHPDTIGIILSGGGSDGTVGMKAIKELGGLLLVQEPEEAEFASMPRSAIGTGLVDFVLPARQLAEMTLELHRMGHRVRRYCQVEEVPENEEAILEKILMHVRARTGHDFGGYKPTNVMRRVARRMHVNQVADLKGYLRVLRAKPEEVEGLLNDLLISVTSFFRDPDAFRALEAVVIPKLFEGRPTEEDVRVWVAGCSTGEEAYSIAILLREYADEHGLRNRLQIFASDIDERALLQGREGLYPKAIRADVAEERLHRFFVGDGESYRVSREIRDLVVFSSHNLLKDPPFSRVDLVSCRNLLIYLQKDLQQKILFLFYYALRPDAFLFLGSAEGAESGEELFTAVDKKQRLFQRERSSSGIKKVLPDLPLTLSPAVPRHLRGPDWREPGQGATDAGRHMRALEMYAPPSVLVDEQSRIIHLSGKAGRFLRVPAGSLTNNIGSMVRKEFRVDLRTALYEVRQKGLPFLSAPIPSRLEGESRTVRLFVQPADREEQATQVLVMFLETASPPGPIPTGEEDPRLHHVERELVQTKERLQMAIEDFESRQEEYRAANEELQSTNEEYKSTLEELETSKEELQSINEELHTVNQELQYNLNEVTGASNDIKNLVEASDLAILFLDRELRITRHTPSLSRLFNVIPADCGRPIGHVTHRLNYPQLQIDAEEVLETEQSIERELLDTDRNWYLVRIIPYRTIRERVEGIVFTFVDITRVKQAEEQLRRSQESHRLLVAGVKEYAIFMLDAEGRISTWNEGAERIFGYDQEEVIGRPGGILLSEKERAVFEEELEQAQNQGESVCERWYLRRDGKPFWGTGVITLLLDSDENRAGFVQVLRDNTLRREAAEALEKSQRELRAFNETLEQRIAERTAEVEGKSRQVHQLASELVLAEQRERHRIAQMLHDHIQQLLYSTKMRLAMLRDEQWPDQLSDMRRMAEEAYEHLTVAIQETRQLTVNLSPPVLRDEGLVQALEWLIHQMSDSHGLRVKLKAKADIVIEAEEMRILVFHIVRELLFNIVKHAEVEAATVELYEDSGLLRVDVSDKGTGFSVEEVFGQRGRHGGLGLLNARERLSLFGGSIQVESQSGAGTKISLSLPIK
jgi:two-component system, chemotaxis family, CheB/CheR fusion protein